MSSKPLYKDFNISYRTIENIKNSIEIVLELYPLNSHARPLLNGVKNTLNDNSLKELNDSKKQLLEEYCEKDDNDTSKLKTIVEHYLLSEKFTFPFKSKKITIKKGDVITPEQFEAITKLAENILLKDKPQVITYTRNVFKGKTPEEKNVASKKYEEAINKLYEEKSDVSIKQLRSSQYTASKEEIDENYFKNRVKEKQSEDNHKFDNVTFEHQTFLDTYVISTDDEFES